MFVYVLYDLGQLNDFGFELTFQRTLQTESLSATYCSFRFHQDIV